MYGIRSSFAFFFAFFVVSYAYASTYVDLDDEIYTILSRLEAEGVIKSGPLTTKPLSRKEVSRLLREAEASSVDRSAFIKGLVRSLRGRLDPVETIGTDKTVLKPIDTMYGKYIRTNSDIQALNYNNDGDIYSRGGNYRLGFTSRLDDAGPLSFFLNPEYRSSGGDQELVLKKAYGVLDFGWDLVVGRDSQWWEPGYHGALLLSNNAEPFTMIKITNPEPVILPWYFRYLGPFRLTFLVTQLEKERNDHPRPFLWGLRLDFKPHQNLTIGLERTAVLGGRGRPADASTWGRSVFGLRENIADAEAGDQRAGYDITLTLPNKYQPVQAYFEADGEDKRGGMPFKWATLTGLYLPRVLGMEAIGLRAEYASTHVPNNPNVWYHHHIYTDGYTYRGRIVGHHMGTDSRDRFFELTYTIPDAYIRVSVAYDIETHDHSDTQPGQEKKNEVFLKFISKIIDNVEAEASYGQGRIRDLGNVPRGTVAVREGAAGIRYRF